MNVRFNMEQCMSVEFAKRLREALSKIGKDEHGAGAYLSRIAKVTPKASSKWLAGESEPRRKLIKIIAENTGVRSEWLEYGEGPKELKDVGQNIVRDLRPEYSGKAESEHFPIIGWVQAGNWNEAVDLTELEGFEHLQYEETNSKVSSKSFWLRVIGDSMTSSAGISIPEGYLILVDPERHPESNDLVIAKLVDTNEVTFKRLVLDSGIKYLKPLNQSYKTIEINGNCRIIGTVREVKLTL